MARFQVGDRVEACNRKGLRTRFPHPELQNGETGEVLEAGSDGMYWVRWDNEALNATRRGDVSNEIFLAREGAGWLERNRYDVTTFLLCAWPGAVVAAVVAVWVLS